MKKYFILVLLFALAFLLSCKSKEASTTLSNPFSEFDKKEDAEKKVGFSITAPDGVSVYRTLKDSMIELLYEDGMCIRKSNSKDEDISGVYNTYSTILNENGVTLKGTNDTFSLAIWHSNKYSYSVYFREKGVSKEELLQIVSSVE